MQDMYQHIQTHTHSVCTTIMINCQKLNENPIKLIKFFLNNTNQQPRKIELIECERKRASETKQFQFH